MTWSSQKKKEGNFCTVYFVQRESFFNIFLYLNVQCNKYTFRIYVLLRIKKHYFIHFLLVFKIAESLQCILNLNGFTEIFQRNFIRILVWYQCADVIQHFFRIIVILKSIILLKFLFFLRPILNNLCSGFVGVFCLSFVLKRRHFVTLHKNFFH